MRIARPIVDARAPQLFIESLEFRTLLSAGALDPTFGTGGRLIVNDLQLYVSSAATQSDGKIVVGGTEFTGGDVDTAVVARFNSDGSLDSSFGTDGVAHIKN